MKSILNVVLPRELSIFHRVTFSFTYRTQATCEINNMQLESCSNVSPHAYSNTSSYRQMRKIPGVFSRGTVNFYDYILFQACFTPSDNNIEVRESTEDANRQRLVLLCLAVSTLFWFAKSKGKQTPDKTLSLLFLIVN